MGGWVRGIRARPEVVNRAAWHDPVAGGKVASKANLAFPKFNCVCYFTFVLTKRSFLSTSSAGALAALLCGSVRGDEWRAPLADRGVSASASYVGEAFGNVRGGRKRGATYEGLLTVNLDLDLEKLFGWKGATVHATGYDPHGAGPTQKFVGDRSVVSNIDFYDSARLFTLWMDQEFLNSRVSLRAGILAVDDEFAGSDYAAVLINSAFGVPSAQAAGFPLPIFAIAAPGVRLKVQPREGFYVQVAAYDGNPAPGLLPDPSPDAAPSSENNDHGTEWSLRPDEGAFLIGEIGVQFNRPLETTAPHDSQAPAPPRGLMGSYKVGFAWHTDTFSDSYDATLIELGSRIAPAQARGVRGNSVLYFIADQELWRESGSEVQGLGAFLRGTLSPPGRNALSHSIDAGFHYTGLWPGRDDDVIAVGFSWLQASPEVSRAVRAANRADRSRVAAPDHEAILELTYRIEVRPGWSVQPDVQWIIHPGGSREWGNALVLGLRTTVEF